MAGAAVGRFVPARAGPTSARVATSTSPAVRPRARGTDRALQPLRRAGQGSSPRARDRRIVRLGRIVTIGFIPARGVVQGEELVTVQGEGLFPRARGRRSPSAGSAST